MDFSTLLGLLIGILSLIIGFLLEGGNVDALIQETAAIIVFGGTIGAVVIGTSGKILKKIPYTTKFAFTKSDVKPNETIEKLVELSNKSRREGLLALESEREQLREDPFLSEGLQMVVDGVEADMIKDILNREIDLYDDNHQEIGKVYEKAGGFSPTMGIIGTVMGLVNVLENISEPETLGPAIAVAFIATLYGVGAANVIYLPIYDKIRSRIDQEIVVKELQLEGLLSIHHGENSTILRKKLLAFLDGDAREKIEQGQGENTSEESAVV